MKSNGTDKTNSGESTRKRKEGLEPNLLQKLLHLKVRKGEGRLYLPEKQEEYQESVMSNQAEKRRFLRRKWLRMQMLLIGQIRRGPQPVSWKSTWQ